MDVYLDVLTIEKEVFRICVNTRSKETRGVLDRRQGQGMTLPDRRVRRISI